MVNVHKNNSVAHPTLQPTSNLESLSCNKV